MSSLVPRLWIEVIWESLWSGTTPYVSIICLPDITARDKVFIWSRNIKISSPL